MAERFPAGTSSNMQRWVRDNFDRLQAGEFSWDDLYAREPAVAMAVMDYDPGTGRTFGEDYNYTTYITSLDLSPEDRDYFLRNRGPNVNLTEQMNVAQNAQARWQGQQQTVEQQATVQSNLDTFLAEQEEYEGRRLAGIDTYATEGEAGIGRVEAEGLGNYQREIGRLTGFIENPASMRSDAQIAGQLKAVEDAIGGQLAQVRAGAAKTMAQTGLRAAGKVDTGVRQAEQAGVYQAGQNISNILGQAGLAKTALGTQKTDFMAGIEDARRALAGDVEARRGAVGGEILGGGYAARSGALSSLSDLTRQAQGIQRPDLFSATGTQYDLRGLTKGWQSMDDSMKIQILGMLLGFGQSAMGQGTQLLGGLMGGKG